MTLASLFGLPGHWTDHAVCGNRQDDLFFPVGNRSTDDLDDQTEKAFAYCRRCPVKTQCLEWALESGQGFGIWGGVRLDDLSAGRRRELRDQLRRRSA